ncbi:hypothetical protein M0R01_04305 [bacterium]|nr:hypothetical protein [bacterium]
MEKFFLKRFERPERGNGSSDFLFDQAAEARRKLAKAYHPDISPGGEEKMKEINSAFDIGDYEYVIKEFGLLKEKNGVREEENTYLQENRKEVMEILDKYPEVAEEVLEAMKKGNYRDVVDILLNKLEESGIPRSVRFIKEKSSPSQKKENSKSSITNTKGGDSNDTYSKLSNVQTMLAEMRAMNSNHENEEEIVKNEQRDKVQDLHNGGEKVKVINFGGKDKKKDASPKNLKEWNPVSVKENPVGFITEILDNIQLQIKNKREIVLPRKALGVVVKLLERELDSTIEEDARIINSAKNAFEGDDMDSILMELHLAQDFFRVDKVFKDFYKEKKDTTISATPINPVDSIAKKPTEKITEKNTKTSEDIYENEYEKLANDIKEIREKISNTDGDYTISDFMTMRKSKAKEGIGSEVYSKSNRDGLNRDNFNRAVEKPSISENASLNNVKNNQRIERKIEAKGDIVTDTNKEKSRQPASRVKDMLGMVARMEELRKEQIKKIKISERLGIENIGNVEIDKDYLATEQKFKKMKADFSSDYNMDIKEVDERVETLNQEIKERRSAFNKEKASEYMQHLKKIVEYQKESLPENKKILFEKMVSVAKNKRAQVIVGAIILGISVVIPEAGGIAWLTGGLVKGILPADLGIHFKVIGGTIGGYVAKEGLETIYTKLLDYKGKVVKKVENILDENIVDDKIKKTANFSKAKSVGFFNDFDTLEVKNNFIEVKKQIIES